MPFIGRGPWPIRTDRGRLWPHRPGLLDGAHAPARSSPPSMAPRWRAGSCWRKEFGHASLPQRCCGSVYFSGLPGAALAARGCTRDADGSARIVSRRLVVVAGPQLFALFFRLLGPMACRLAFVTSARCSRSGSHHYSSVSLRAAFVLTLRRAVAHILRAQLTWSPLLTIAVLSVAMILCHVLLLGIDPLRASDPSARKCLTESSIMRAAPHLGSGVRFPLRRGAAVAHGRGDRHLVSGSRSRRPGGRAPVHARRAKACGPPSSARTALGVKAQPAVELEQPGAFGCRVIGPLGSPKGIAT